MLRLTATWDDQIRQFPLSESGRMRLRLGAAPDNDLVLPAPGVSRRHARLESDGRSLVLTDLGSKNGLVRDHRRHSTLQLDPGGPAVFLGRAQVYLEEVAPADVEIALELDGSARGYSLASGSLSWIETAALRLEGAPSSPGGALRLVREIEGLQDDDARQQGRQDLLEKARRVLGAEALLAVDRAEEKTLLVEQAGRLPDERLLEELAPVTPDTASGSRTPEVGELEPVGDESPRWRVLGSLGSGRGPELLAVLPGDADDLGWRRDLMVVLGARLFGAEGEDVLDETAEGPAPLEEEKGLVLPDEMVVGPSPALRELLEELRSAVRSDLDLLLTGETGSGKELIARAIHLSSRPDGPFVALNCAAIPGELLEAELFGVEAGVATGVEPRSGRLVAADGGTLFLDEIGELDGRLQAKLLRVLQEREVLPLGASGPRKVDVRVVSATNRDLAMQVEEGRFRSDLYFRLRGLELRAPPLRHRLEDLSQLVLSFARRAAERYGKRVRGVSRAALGQLLHHDWPGNIRELKHAVERAVLRCPDGGVLDRRCFGELTGPRAGTGPETPDPSPSGEATESPRPVDRPSAEPPPAPTRTLQEQVDEVERRAILEALAFTRGNKTQAAERLRITRNGLNLKIKRLGIQYPPE